VKNKTIIVTAILFTLITGGGLWFFFNSDSDIPFAPSITRRDLDLPIFETYFKVKESSSSPKTLLLKPANEKGVFQFDEQSGTFTRLEDSIWETFDGHEAVCSPNFQSVRESENIGYGKHTLYKLEDSKNSRLAVLSANGSFFAALSPKFDYPGLKSEPFVKGMRYFNMISPNSGKDRKLTFRIKELQDYPPRMCWSPDEDFVIIFDRSTIAIVSAKQF
jgi:hypothetical protein